MKIIYEDGDVLALNKPPGVVVHPDKFHKNGTLVDEVIEKYPEIKDVGDDPSRPGIVHRLDKDTSGVILIAKNQRAFEYLKNQFQERKIEKRYKVLVTGCVKDNEGVVNFPIGRSAKDPTKRVAIGKMRGKIREAVTEYKVLKRYENFTLVEAFPKTGRTHQIRSHFSAIGYPVVCDRLYAGKRFICPEGLGRHFLHASSIELTFPSGLRTRLDADMPEDLERTLKHLQRL